MKKIVFSISIFTLLFLTSCNDYLDVNVSENAAHTSDIPPSALLANALSQTFATQAVTMNEYGNLMSNAWGANSAVYTGAFSNEFQMNFATTTRQGIWTGSYSGMDLFNKMINFPNDGSNDNYVGIAKIMKSYHMQYIVDLYGSAPYSQAFKGSENFTPAYDSDKAIYTNLFADLDSAILTLTTPSANASSVGAEDIVYNGDTTEWVKFANTVELKMCLRMSNVTDPTMIALRESHLANLVGVSLVDSDVTLNPGYNSSTDAQYNPFSLFYSRIWDAVNGTTSPQAYSSRLICASLFMANVMNGTVNIPGIIVAGGVKDPRRTKMFRTTNVVNGIDQGVTAPGTYAASLLGSGLTGFAGTGGQDAFENAESRDGYLMLKSESLFLQAEAEYRVQNNINNFGSGLSLGFGSPQVLFNNAVTASFDHYNAPFGTFTPAPLSPTAPVYLGNGPTGIGNKLGLGWAGTPNKLQCILTQKWLALSGINGIEPFLDKVRTGFPANPLSTSTSRTSSPRRLLYPASEYSTNAVNVPVVNLDDLFTVNTFTPFWVTN